ncbi:hypothetical protein E2C01_083591 [Portunus trituberculatus]|uniref:Uncharacterized protein n=1 Tax=Portunus trituberculatus TaxID=210409 RepID=A0A5B7J2I4_PORTR|nr:hypothetical protein [Portunus trituberculatus]
MDSPVPVCHTKVPIRAPAHHFSTW